MHSLNVAIPSLGPAAFCMLPSYTRQPVSRQIFLFAGHSCNACRIQTCISQTTCVSYHTASSQRLHTVSHTLQLPSLLKETTHRSNLQLRHICSWSQTLGLHMPSANRNPTLVLNELTVRKHTQIRNENGKSQSAAVYAQTAD